MRALRRSGSGAVCMFHRERRWNDQGGPVDWVGTQARQAARAEPVAARRHGHVHRILHRAGDRLQQVKYIITLDSDTILGRDGARSLIATLAHPLNRAEADPETGQVRRGYGLLQPRTEIIPASANYSHFSRIFAGDIGLDLYTNAVSNVYQDLFRQRHLRWQRHLRHRRLRKQPGRTRAREYPAQSRPV
jgi:cyclic beta-1,2-glucan synthetase